MHIFNCLAEDWSIYKSQLLIFPELTETNHDFVYLYFRVEWLVLDEGDKLFEATQDGFRDQVSNVLRYLTGSLLLC